MGCFASILGLAAVGLCIGPSDVSRAPIPDAPVRGQVFGQGFEMTKAVIFNSGTSSIDAKSFGADAVRFYHVEFRDKREGQPRRDVQIRIAIDMGKSLEGTSILWRPYADDTPEDRIQKTLVTNRVRIARGVRWISVDTYPLGGGEANSTDFRENISLRLEFGKAKNGILPGRVVASIPDPGKSWVAGTFRAEYRPAR